MPPEQDNPLTQAPYPVPREMTRFDMDHVVNGFVETARGAMEAGFDGFELHCAHGYLLSQFLSSKTNRRTDAYGGSMENRFRFIHEVIQAVRPEIPMERLFVVRISNWGIADMEIPHFESREEWQEMVERFSDEPIDAISLSTYNFRDKAFGTDKTMAALTREVTELPLMICGKIHDRASAEEALEEADLVLSGKSMLLNPNWVEDVRSGKEMPAHSSEEAGIAYTDTPLP